MTLKKFHKNRYKFTLLTYGVALAIDDTEFLKHEENGIVLRRMIRESIAERGMRELSFVITENGIVLTMDVPLGTDLASFINVIKTRTQKVMKKASDHIWGEGYCIYTTKAVEQTDEAIYEFFHLDRKREEE